MKTFVRYETPDENDETRRQRNEKFGEETPELNVPIEGRYLWDWYFDIQGMFQRVRDGACTPIPPSEFLAWAELTGTIVYTYEYDILRGIDKAYCDEYTKELQDYRTRREEEFQRKTEEAKQKSGKRGR